MTCIKQAGSCYLWFLFVYMHRSVDCVYEPISYILYFLMNDIFDNRKELPRAFWVPNSQQDIWALFELIFCLPIQTNRFQRRFFVFYVCFVTSIGVQIPNTNYQMFLSNSKRNPASEANSSYFKLEANKLVICILYLVTV